MQILKSELDDSINFVTKTDIGMLEARYVRREKEYFIGYLSSQTGCNQGCKFCHLTTTDQKQFRNASHKELHQQAKRIFEYYYKTQHKDNPARILNWNFMARGEPLANPFITEASTTVFNMIAHIAQILEEDIIQRFNISTIMPIKLKKPLEECFPVIQPTIYYSIYSTSDVFRKKWMPAAMPVNDALRMLKAYQDVTGKEIKFHSPMIKGENDDFTTICDMMDAIKDHGIRGSFNLVRYNPYSPNEGEETNEENLVTARDLINNNYMPCRIVTRVGEDIAASCGMFINNS